MTQVATQKSNLPAHLQGYKGEGIAVPSSEVTLPYLGLGQSIGKAVKEGKVKYGEIYNSVTFKTFGKEVEIAVIDYRIDWKEFDKSGALVRTSADGTKWSNDQLLTEEDKWKHKFYNYFVMVPSEGEMPFILSLAHTSAKTGKALLNIIAQTTNMANLPPFTKLYTLSAKEEMTEGNSYIVWKVAQKDGWTDEATCKKAEKIRTFLKSAKIKMDDIRTEEPAKEANPF